MDDVDLIEITVTSSRHKRMSEGCVPYTKDEETVVFFGKGGSKLMFHNTLKEIGIKKKILLGETAGIPACSGRRSGYAQVNRYCSKVFALWHTLETISSRVFSILSITFRLYL